MCLGTVVSAGVRGVSVQGVCGAGGGVTNTYKEKAGLLSKPLSILKLLSKPGNNCQAAIHFLLGGGKSRPGGRVTTASQAAGIPEPPSLSGTPAKGRPHGPLAVCRDIFSNSSFSGAEGGASDFHLGRNNFCQIFILHPGKSPRNREKM